MNTKLGGLEVTEVRIKLADDPTHPNLRGFASICLNGEFVIRNLNIIQPERESTRIFVSFPTKVLKSGRRMDVAHPATPWSRAWIEGIVIEAYLDELRRVAPAQTPVELAEAC